MPSSQHGYHFFFKPHLDREGRPRPLPCLNSCERGLTLIELILSMVIISVALVGVLSVMNLTVRNSADPLIQHQALAIAEAYLEEILLQAYDDPNGTNVGENRATYDNVADYNGLNDAGALDQRGNAIPGLSSYGVSVAVTDQVIAGLTARRVAVTVIGPGFAGLTVAGYKFNNSL